jgi:hypothetical protein
VAAALELAQEVVAGARESWARAARKEEPVAEGGRGERAGRGLELERGEPRLLASGRRAS